jgi:hypothetical protein
MKTLGEANYDLLYGGKKPVTCPVCSGKGLVPYGFYEIGRTEFAWGGTSCPTETCRSCNGKGYINCIVLSDMPLLWTEKSFVSFLGRWVLFLLY